MFEGKKLKYFCLSVLVLILLFKGVNNHRKQLLTHDESISFLAISSNLKAYNQLIKQAELKAFQIKQLFEVDSVSFKGLAKDMSNLDVHPPLYYYLSSVLFYFTGPELSVLLWFNWILLVISMLYLFKLGANYLSGTKPLLLVVFWSLSPVVFYNTFEARHYLLFEVLSFMYLYLALKKGDKTTKDYILIYLVCSLGFLTHYYFSLLILAVVLTLIKTQNKFFLKLIILSSASLILVFFLNPYYFDPLLDVLFRPKEASLVVSDTSKWIKLKAFFFSHLALFSDQRLFIYLSSIALIVAAFLGREKLKNVDESIVLPFIFLFILSLVLYVFGITPTHALSYKYFCFGWGLLFIVFSQLFNDKVIVVLTSLMILVNVFSFTRNGVKSVATVPKDLRLALTDAEQIEVSSLSRGDIPRLSMLLSDSCDIIINEDLDNEDVFKVKIHNKASKQIDLEGISFLY